MRSSTSTKHAGSGTAREFVDAVDGVIARITEFPENHPIVHARLRLARLRRFPYLILFAVETNAIVVYRCVHTRRDPRRWREPIR